MLKYGSMKLFLGDDFEVGYGLMFVLYFGIFVDENEFWWGFICKVYGILSV